MTTPPDLPNTYDIAKALIDQHGHIPHDKLFAALQEHWSDDGCVARITEAVADGTLIEAPTMRYRLGVKNGLPDPSPERTKIEEIGLLKALLTDFEESELECYCVECFFDFVSETLDDMPSPPTHGERVH